MSCEGVTSCTSLVDTLCAVFDLHNLSAERQSDLLKYLIRGYTSTPLLLILDNFETVWDTGHAKPESEVLLQTLGQVPLLSLILTMRGTIPPHGLRWTPSSLTVKPLEPVAARQVFLEICRQVDDGKLDDLLHALDYVPLAVTLIARLGFSYTPGDLLKKWEKEKTQLLSHPDDQGRLTNVDKSISISIQSPRMQSIPVALNLLSILALLPGGVHSDDLVKITPSLEKHDLAVTTLLQVGLIYRDIMDNLRVLSPIRAYIIQHHTPTTKLLNDVLTYFFTLAESGKKAPGDAGYQTTVVTLKKVESNMEAILRLAVDNEYQPEHSIKAALNWTHFLFFQTPRSDIIELAVRLAKKKYLTSLLASCLQSLGNVQRMIQHYEEAQQVLYEAQSIFEAVRDYGSAAQCLWSLGDIQRMLNHYDESQKMFSKAQSRFEAIGYQGGAAQCLRSLGNLQRMLYHYDEAQQMLYEAKSKLEEIGDQHGAAQCLQSLGDLQRRLHHYDRAQEILSDAQSRFEVIGSQLGAAQSLWSQGDIQCMLHHHDKAQQILSKAQSRFEAIGDQLGISKCLKSLGDIQCMLKNYDEAQKMLSKAQSIFEAVREYGGAAHCLKSLGNIQHMLKHHNKAQQMLCEAQSRLEEIGDQCGAAQCLLDLGNIHCMLSHYDEAQQAFFKAQSIFEAIQDQHGVAQCLQSLGDVQHKLHNHEEAQWMFSEAKSRFEEIGDLYGASFCLMSLGYTSKTQGMVEATTKYFTLAKESLAQFGALTKAEQEECSAALVEVSNLKVSYYTIITSTCQSNFSI